MCFFSVLIVIYTECMIHQMKKYLQMYENLISLTRISEIQYFSSVCVVCVYLGFGIPHDQNRPFSCS